VPKADALNPKFLKWLLLSKPAQQLIWSHATGSTAKGIKQRTFRKLKFGFPKLSEQIEIARLLEDIDLVREVAKRNVKAYVCVKTQLMTDLLSGRVRVPA
jgi:type I restriction enzyme S subunit